MRYKDGDEDQTLGLNCWLCLLGPLLTSLVTRDNYKPFCACLFTCRVRTTGLLQVNPRKCLSQSLTLGNCHISVRFIIYLINQQVYYICQVFYKKLNPHALWCSYKMETYLRKIPFSSFTSPNILAVSDEWLCGGDTFFCFSE